MIQSNKSVLIICWVSKMKNRTLCSISKTILPEKYLMKNNIVLITNLEPILLLGTVILLIRSLLHTRMLSGCLTSPEKMLILSLFVFRKWYNLTLIMSSWAIMSLWYKYGKKFFGVI